MNTITNLNNFPIGNSLDGINIITEEINTLSLLVDGTNSMLADLNMNNHIIKNMEAGVESLDAVNKSQLDLKADTTYVNTQLALKVNKAGDTMTGALNMNTTNKIINLANGTNNGDAVNRSQLNTKADTSYVNTQLGLKLNKAGDTMTGALNMNSTNKIINLANGTSIGDAINLGQLTAINNILTADINDLENYVDTQDTELRTYTDSSLNSLRDYINTQDTADRVYVDSSLNLLRSYVDTQDNLKVNKAGDTMTGNLLMSGLNGIRFNNDPTLTDGASLAYATNFKECILSVNSGATNRGFDLRVATGNPLSSTTRIWAQADGKVGINTRTPEEIFDVNGNSKIRGYLDMSLNKIVNLANGADPNDAINKSQLDNVDTNIRTDVNSALNLKVNKAGDTMTGALSISKNARNITPVVRNTIDYNVSNGFIESISFTQSQTNIQIPGASSSDTVFLNKTMSVEFVSSYVMFWTSGIFYVNGSAYSFFTYETPTSPTRVQLIGSSVIGYYTFKVVSAEEEKEYQLSLKSDLGSASTEYTGIEFVNSSINAGNIRIDTNLDHTTSTMSIETLDTTGIIKPLSIGNTITAFKPVVFSDDITVNGGLTANNVITLNGGTSTDSGVDTNNRNNTYIKFGPAGATSDWAYLRQIGGSNMINMSLDFLDDYDGGFSFRNVQSTTNPDTVREFFKITRTRGFFSPTGIIMRNTGTSTTGINLNNETGKFIVWVYGTSKLNGVFLPDPVYTDVGTTIYVYNCTSQTLDIRTYGNEDRIYKNSGNSNITTLIQPQGAIFMFDGTDWIGSKISISNF